MDPSTPLFFLKIIILFGIVYSIIKHLKMILIILVLIFLFLMIQSYFDISFIEIARNYLSQ